MPIQIEHVGAIAVVTAQGSFRGGIETDELQATLRKLILEDRKRTVLDMSHVELMTSYAIGIVIVAHTQAEKSGVDFALCGIQRRIDSVLQITNRFGPSLRIFGARKEALEALQET